jgi:RHS repeat-associated protein
VSLDIWEGGAVRSGRGVVAGLLVLVVLFGLGGVEPSPGVGGPSLSWGDARTWLRDALVFDAWSGWWGPEEAPAEPTAELALPGNEVAPVGEPAPDAQRVAELTDLRTEAGTFWQMSDGGVEAEIAAAPVHYRDGDGGWRPIDTTVVPSDRDGVVLENTSNMFGSFFGASSDELARFELDGRSVTVGLPGAARAVAPSADGDAVTFPDAFGAGTDVRYEVAGGLLKEEIVLAEPPAGAARFGFTLELEGLAARELPDGSIGLWPAPGDTDVAPLLVLPPPFMFDSADDPSSPYGSGWSPAVTQSLRQVGDRLLVVVEPEAGWLADPGRVYPVTVDPTIKVQPPVNEMQDSMILSDDPDLNFEGNWRLSVGTTGIGVARSLVRFDLSGVPDGTVLDTAALELYFDQEHTTGDVDVPLEARAVTGPWDESTVTWNQIADALGPAGANVELVDESDSGKVAAVGEWPASGSSLTQFAIKQTYRFNNNASGGDTFTWVPELTEDGEYRVQVHYVAAFDRASAAPYTVHHAGGQSTVTVNQQAGSEGEWADLGTYQFQAGSSHKVVLGDVPGQAVIADAVRFIKAGTVVKEAGQSSVWHSYDVRNITQQWVDGTAPNHGFAVKATDEDTLGQGGPRYEAAEFAYNGESRNTPKLVLSWGQPGVELAAPERIYATGPELSWAPFAGEGLVEYQVHRSVFQGFTPSQATLVAPVPAATTQFTDTTATPTPVDDPDPFGQVFYYMVAAKTAGGELVAGPTRIVRLPRAGRVVQVLQGDAPDTTLTAGQPGTNQDVLADNPWLMAGNNSATFGTSRAVVAFPDVEDKIPAGARVLDAEFGVWSVTTIGSGATNNVHALTRGFSETGATWNQAQPGVPWTSPGGDFDPTVGDVVIGNSNDPAWRFWYIDPIVQGWVDDPQSNAGLLLKLADETSPAERTLYLSSEAAEPKLRPKLTVVYTEPTPAQTYHAPETPATRMLPGDDYTIPVTVSNPTGTTLSALEWELSYRWELPDGTDVTTGGNQLASPLPDDIAPGGAVDVPAGLRTPIQSDEGNKRSEYVLRWELRNKQTGQWLSEVHGIGSLDQNVVVEDPTSDQLGLENFYQYTGVNTGAGQAAMVNTHAGNLTLGYNAFANPGRGLATHVRMVYNSQDTSASSMGFGWSLAGSTIARLGSPLEFHPKGQDWPTDVTLVDGDGTSHFFTLDKHGSTDPADWEYDSPAGVHLFLQRNVAAGDPARAWVMTKPDRTQFFFDTDGYPSAVADRNGNTQTFTYEQRRSQNQPIKFLRYVTDPSGRQSLTLDYYRKGDDYQFVDDAGDLVSDTNLTNPFIIDQVRSITDVDGRRIELFYTGKGLTARLVDGAGTAVAKTFKYVYDTLQGNKNVKLVEVTDPRGNTTGLAYYNPPPEPKFHWWAASITARDGGVTSFTYVDPDGQAGSVIETTGTDPEDNPTLNVTDGFGRPTQVVDALARTTELTWDADNNVVALEEDNGAVTSWTYDQQTGYPLTIRDPEANANGTPATVLTYQTGLGGHIAELASKTSPEGRTWQFGYDLVGNLTSVTDPANFASTYEYDAVGQLIRAIDANQHPTTFGSYHDTGYPELITDALGGTVETVYDQRGNVREVVDEVQAITTVDYDVFSRPLEMVTSVDLAAGEFITTPAPVYDTNDNVGVATAPNGAVTSTVYDPADRPVQITLPEDTPGGPDRVTTVTYDHVGNVLSDTEPLGNLTPADPNDHVTTYAYDQIYQLLSVTDAEGNQSSKGYDTVGNLIQTTDARGNPTSYAYDLNHRLTTVTDAAGQTTSTEYDLDSMVVATIDQAGVRTETDYDQRGLPAEVRSPHRPGSTRITRTEYDPVGNPVRVTSPRGAATTGEPDDFVQDTVYDPLNRPVEQILPYDPGDPDHDTPDSIRYTYDPAGRVTTVSAPPSAGQAVRNETVTSYLDTGWIETTTDPWDIVTSYQYNLLGQQTGRTLTSAGGSSGRTMTSDYFPDGKLAARSDDGVPVGLHVVLVDNSDTQNVDFTGAWTTADTGDGLFGFDYATSTTGTGQDTAAWTLHIPADGSYEAFARWPQITGAATDASYTVTHDGGSTPVTVNQSQQTGQWVSLGDFDFMADNGGSITLSDDANGTVVADAVKLVRDTSGETDTEAKDLTYAYDVNGNLIDITDQSSDATVDAYSVTYDGLNRVEQVEELLGGVVQNTSSFTYNQVGAPLTRTHDDNHASFAYDVRNLLTTVTNGESASDPDPKLTSYTYNARGQRATETKANGNTVTFDYWPDGALREQVETKPDATVVASHIYEYDLNGNRSLDTSRQMNADSHSDYLHRVSTFGYDPRDRLASVNRTDPGTGAQVSAESYTHDANNNVISQTIDGTTTTSTYDRNRLQRTVTAEVSSSYNYDPFGRLDTVTAAGQATQRYVYDGFDRVVEQHTDGAVTEKTYDPLDRTATKTTDAGTAEEGTTEFVYLGLTEQVLAEIVDGQVTTSYQHDAAGQPLSQTKHDPSGTDPDEDSFYGYNPHGDVAGITDETGNTRATYGYTAYGSDDESLFTGVDRPDAGDPEDQEPYNAYRYAGKRFDHGTGTYDMGFRDYHPGLNRFLTRDVFNGALADLSLGANPWSLGRYTFAAGNPTTLVEYDGHLAVRDIDGGGGGGGAGGGSSVILQCSGPEDCERQAGRLQGTSWDPPAYGGGGFEQYIPDVLDTARRLGVDSTHLLANFMMESYRCLDIAGAGGCRMMQNFQKNMTNPWWALASPLIPLAGRLGGQGDEASIGLANFDKGTFEVTQAAHPELAGRSWDELLDDPKLNIDAMAYRMMDLEAMLPAQLNTTRSRGELVRMGYRTGERNMLSVATGQLPMGNESRRLNDVYLNQVARAQRWIGYYYARQCMGGICSV